VEEVHIHHPAPSKAARNSELVSNQNSTGPHAVFNARPSTLVGPPLSIYHPIFQNLCENTRSRLILRVLVEKTESVPATSWPTLRITPRRRKIVCLKSAPILHTPLIPSGKGPWLVRPENGCPIDPKRSHVHCPRVEELVPISGHPLLSVKKWYWGWSRRSCGTGPARLCPPLHLF